jgi:hypothetical protein
LSSPAAGVKGRVAQPKETRSNILRADYVGSAACASCHADVYAKWSASPMRKMTRDPDQAEIRAPFAGETFDFKGDQATMFREGARASCAWFRARRASICFGSRA